MDSRLVRSPEDPRAEFMSPQGLVVVRPYQPGDERAIIDLFKTVFNVDRTMDIWNWEFRDCPEGIHSYVGALEDGRIVSQFCGIPVRTKVRDQRLIFSQMVDSMVHPEFRSGLKKKGLFATTVDTFVECYGHLDREVIMMGLPNPEAFRVGRKLCGYTPMTKVYVHSKRVEPDTGLGPPDEVVSFRFNRFRVHPVLRFEADVEELYERVAARHEVIVERRQRYLNWRYPESPQWNYTLLECRNESDDRLVGMAVLRRLWLGEPDLMIADWLVDPEVEGAGEALLARCEFDARKAGMTRVTCLLNQMAPESRLFEDQGYDLAPTRFRMVSRTYAPDVVAVEWLNRHWYYTMGDFDVV